MTELNGIEVRFMRSGPTHVWYQLQLGAFEQPYLVFHSPTALAYAMAGVQWHDDQDRCPMWTGDECRCDVEANP